MYAEISETKGVYFSSQTCMTCSVCHVRHRVFTEAGDLPVLCESPPLSILPTLSPLLQHLYLGPDPCRVLLGVLGNSIRPMLLVSSVYITENGFVKGQVLSIAVQILPLPSNNTQN